MNCTIMNDDISISDLYKISILEVLKERSEIYKDDRYKAAAWKAKITEEVKDHIKKNYKDTGKRGKGSDIHRSTVGRHIKKLLEENLVESVLFPEGTNSYADRGYIITQKGMGYLEAVNGQGGLAREYGSLCMGNYIFERHLDSCDMCPMDPKECEDNIHTYLRDGLGISRDIVDEIIDGGYDLKDVKEAVDLILTWQYLRNGVKHCRPDAGQPHKKNDALKLMAMRDPRIMDIVCNTYALPVQDIIDIFVNLGLIMMPPVPMDQYLIASILIEEDRDLSIDEIQERLSERGIRYDPKTSLECVDGSFLMEKVEVDGVEKYRVTEMGKRMMSGVEI